MYDIIIKNGKIVDGTGSPMFLGDVGIRGREIKKIGELHNEKADVIIDAAGKLVCPGFIDVNNHSDTYWQIFLEPDLLSLVYQGVTTIVGGNCGSSLAPLAEPRTIESIQKWIDLKKINVNWLRTNEFFDFLEQKKISVNFATLVGHATLRRGVLKDENRSLNPKELAFVEKMLTDSMQEGALGISSGLIYTHAHLTSTDELIDLAKAVRKFDGVYATHIRGEKNDLLEAVEEAVRIARESGVKLHISHLKAMGESNWSKMDAALDIIDHAYETGVDVTFDVFPYTNTGSVLYALLPAWVSEGGRKLMISRLRESAVREKVIAEMRASEFDYTKIEIAISPLGKSLARRNISEIAASQEKSIEDIILDILIASEGRVITSMEVLSEENVKKLIKHPLSVVASNGSGYNIEHKKSGELVHTRCFGSFARLLEKYVKQEKLLTWEAAIQKITGLPARKFGLLGRGVLKEKNFADIVVLDPKKIRSLSSKENPFQYSEGIEHTLVNGKLILKEGQYLNLREGEIIRRS